MKFSCFLITNMRRVKLAIIRGCRKGISNALAHKEGPPTFVGKSKNANRQDWYILCDQTVLYLSECKKVS